ncbi:MAG: glycosyltransferase [Acidimicrobiia bacterium]
MPSEAMPPEVAPRWDVVVTAGGTGGHVLPALAVVEELVARGVGRDRIGFLGGRRGIEGEAVPAAGISFRGLDVRGLRRGFSWAAIAANVSALWAMLRAVRAARGILHASGAGVVVAMGGYASVPAVLAARRRSRRLVVYESNSVPGVATKLAARRATVTTCALESTVALLPRAQRIGFVVRRPLERFGTDPALVEDLAAEARAVYGIDAARRVVVVMGGSQGAHSLNEAVLGLAREWRDRDDLAVVHLVGRREIDAVLEAARPLEGSALTYVPIGFEDHIDRVYAVCDLMVCRAGASTCAELAATGTAAVCVPYPHATADHQRLNAEALAAAGAAAVLPDAAVSAASLAECVGTLLSEPHRLGAMQAAAAALGAADGAALLAERVIGLLGEAA